jgi:hypothetical protein
MSRRNGRFPTERIIASLCLALAVSAFTACSQAPESGADDDATMRLHHLHSAMNHGFGMVLRGGDLIMLARMGMVPDVDAITLEHGKSMLQTGRQLIQETVSSPAMEELHAGGNVPQMSKTHDLGEAMTAVADSLDRMAEAEMSGSEAMKLHHMHILLSHSGQMAAEGTNLIMLGRMGMAGTVDAQAVSHGEHMMAEAGEVWTKVMEGDTMQSLHSGGASSEAMTHTHELGDAIMRVIDLLSEVHGVGHGH